MKYLNTKRLYVKRLDMKRYRASLRSMPRRERDSVDAIVDQWRAVRPDVDVSPMGIVGRASRLSRLIDRRLEQNFQQFGIESWMFDVLATLRRTGEPYELTAGELVIHTMVTTGAMTNRIDRLEERQLVERRSAGDRRKVVVALTVRGRELVDEVLLAHLATEREILAGLSTRQRAELVDLLRIVLLGLGDSPPS
jgi:DNA-binding MarR family transcriptional regulator